MSNSPKFQDSYYSDRAENLALMQAFKDGRKAVGQLLHKWERETSAGYKSRQDTSTLFNQTKKTIKTANGMIFRKEISYDSLNKAFEARMNNIDGADTNLNEFAKDLSEGSLWDGLSYILVDTPQNDEEIVNLQQQIAKGIVPYFTKIKNSQLSNRRVINNKLTQVTILETVMEYEGDFGEKEIEQERVLTIGGGKIYREDEVVYEWANSLNFIPLVPVYTNKIGFMDATPRYLDLVELNLKHFNYQSQLDKTLFIAANPIPKIWGKSETNTLTIGVDQAMQWANKEDGDFEWGEFEGTSVDKLQEEIKNIEARMFSIGISLLTEKEQTATEAAIVAAGENSDLSAISSSISASLNTAYQYWCEMMNQSPTGEIKVNKDFTGITLSPAEAKIYLDMYNSGALTLEQLWIELQDREYISEFDVDVAKADLEAKNQDVEL